MRRHMKKLRMPPQMVQQLVGMSRDQIERITLEALDRAGVDISDPKAISWERMADGGCAFTGPPKVSGS